MSNRYFSFKHNAIVCKCSVVSIAAVLLMSVACSSAPKEPEVEQVDALEQTQLEVKRAQAELAQSARKPVDAEKAKQLAARHLAIKQVGWGKPVSVEEDEEHFYVTYQTPEQELRLIGARVLIVDKHSRVVTAQKRR